jgi:hypothetical protein
MTAFDTAWSLLKMPLYEMGDKAPKTWNERARAKEGDLDGFLHNLRPHTTNSISWASELDDARGMALKDGLIHAFAIPHQLQGQGLGRERLLEMIAEIQTRYPNFKPYVNRDEILDENAHKFWSQRHEEGHVDLRDDL